MVSNEEGEAPPPYPHSLPVFQPRPSGVGGWGVTPVWEGCMGLPLPARRPTTADSLCVYADRELLLLLRRKAQGRIETIAKTYDVTRIPKTGAHMGP